MYGTVRRGPASPCTPASRNVPYPRFSRVLLPPAPSVEWGPGRAAVMGPGSLRSAARRLHAARAAAASSSPPTRPSSSSGSGLWRTTSCSFLSGLLRLFRALGRRRLIAFWDDNGFTIKALGWQGLTVQDGNIHGDVTRNAIAAAKACTTSPRRGVRGPALRGLRLASAHGAGRQQDVDAIRKAIGAAKVRADGLTLIWVKAFIGYGVPSSSTTPTAS